MSDILITIVIATKDRYDTLLECIKSLSKNYNRSDVDIVIHDNSTIINTNIVEIIRKNFGFVNYYYTSNPLSQSENYNQGLEKAKGYYVTMIGDDDTISDGLFRLLDFMKRNNLDAIYPGFSTFFWPGVKLRYNSKQTNQILIPREERASSFFDPNKLQLNCLKNGSTELGILPRLYYGIIKKSCLEALKKSTGTFFPGPSPDMANAFAISFFIRRYYYVYYPIFIAGNSASSAAGLGLQGKHVGVIDNLKFIPEFTKVNWNRLIPRFWSGETIWAQSVYEACLKSGLKDFFQQNNFIKLYAKCLVFHFSFRHLTMDSFREYNANFGALNKVANTIKLIFSIMSYINKRAIIFIRNRVRHFISLSVKEKVKNTHLPITIHEAEELVSQKISSCNNLFL